MYNMCIYVYSRDAIKVLVYGQGVESFSANMSSCTPASPQVINSEL